MVASQVHPYFDEFGTDLNSIPRTDIYGYPAAVGLMITGIATVFILRLHDAKHLRYVALNCLAFCPLAFTSSQGHNCGIVDLGKLHAN